MRKVDSRGRLHCKGCEKWFAVCKFKQFSKTIGSTTYTYPRSLCIECWNIRNRAHVKAWKAANTAYVRQKALQVRRSNKLEFIAAYGGRCKCCKEARAEFLTLDHVNGRSEHKRITGYVAIARLKAKGWPRGGFQLLCFNCNSAKGIYGSCPHTWKKGQFKDPLDHSGLGKD